MAERCGRWRDARRGSALAVARDGGMLLGYRVRREIVVQSTISPGPKARHWVWIFTPDGKWQGEEFERRYVDAGRIQTCLGDWRSHLVGEPLPSSRDDPMLWHGRER